MAKRSPASSSSVRSVRCARAAVAIARRQMGRRRGVVSIHWGLGRTSGRKRARPSVVVFVRCKRPIDALPAARRLPRSVTVRLDGRTRVVPVDVQSVGRRGLLLAGDAGDVRPGMNVRLCMDQQDGDFDGALGAVLGTDLSARAVLSGHVAERGGRAVWASTVYGQFVNLGNVETVIRSANVDVAWTTAAPLSTTDLGLAPRAVRDPIESDVGHSASILVPWDYAGRLATIDDVGATATFGQGDSAVTLHGLFTLHPAVTTPGDSGAPILDDNGVLVGFVVGASGDKTYAVPARRAIDALESH